MGEPDQTCREAITQHEKRGGGGEGGEADGRQMPRAYYSHITRVDRRSPFILWQLGRFQLSLSEILKIIRGKMN